MLELRFGGGMIAISAGRRIDGNILIMEPNRGVGELGASVPTRRKDSLIVPDEEGVVLAFKNAASVQVVIDELLNVKKLFDEPITQHDASRLQGAHEALGLNSVL